MSTRKILALVSASTLLSGCGDSAADTWTGTVTDSAGITIVQNPQEGLWDPGEGWTVVEELNVGSIEGDASYQFGQIVGVDVGKDGHLYVADIQAGEVRVFDGRGEYVRTIGRPGSGPGELGPAIAGVFVVGQEVIVPDLGNARINRFTLEGEPVGSSRLDVTQGIPIRWDRITGDRIVAQRRAVALGDDSAVPTGDVVVTMGIHVEESDTLLTLPIGESVQLLGGQPRVRMFEPEPIWDAGDDGSVVMGMNSNYHIEVYDDRGALVRVVTRPYQSRDLTERDQGVIKDALREAIRLQGAPPQAAEAFLSQLQFADHYPAFALLAVGPQGSMWIQRMRSGNEIVGESGTFDAQDLGSMDWDVFDGEGRYLGVVTFPGKYQPIRAIGDRFYGIARDELDVQSLKVFRVVTG